MKTKRPGDSTSTAAGASGDVTAKSKARPGKKTSPTTVPTDTLEKVESPRGSAPAERPKAKLPGPKGPRRADKPQGLRHASIPGMPSDAAPSIPLPQPPGAGLFREDWQAYRETHASFPDDLKRIEPRYHRISAFHSQLSHTHQRLRVNAIGLRHSLQPMDSLPPWQRQEWTSHRSAQENYAQHLKTHHQKVHDFKMLLSSTGLTQNSKRDALKNTLRQKFEELPVIKPIDTSFLQVYSTFVQAHGLEAALQHHFNSLLNTLLSQRETLTSTLTLLNQQRAHYREMASTSVSTNNLKQTLSHLNTLHNSYSALLPSHRALQKDITSFITSVESVSTQQEAAQKERAQLQKRKANLFQKLQALPDIQEGSTVFKLDYDELLLKYGQQQCKDSGLESSCNELILDQSKNSYTCRKLQLFSQSLLKSVQQAQTLHDLDAFESSLFTLQESIEKYQKDFDSHSRNVSLFHKTMHQARQQFSKGTLTTRRTNALQRFVAAPLPQERVLPINAEARRAINTLPNPSLRSEQQQRLCTLEDLFLQLRHNEHTLTGLKQTIQDNASSESSQEGVQQLEDDVQSYLELLALHTLNITSYKERKSGLLGRIPAAPPTSDAVKPVASPGTPGQTTKPLALSPEMQQFLSYLQSTSNPLENTITLGSLSLGEGTLFSPTASDRVHLIREVLANDPAQKLDALNQRGRNLVHTILFASHFTGEEQARLLDGIGELGADFNLPDHDDDTPLDLTLKLSITLPPVVIDALQRNGANLSLRESLPITAHLLGTGGKIPLTTPAGKMMIDLEGLAERFAQFGFDPLIRSIVIQTGQGASPPMKGPLHAARSAWQNTRDYPGFIKTLQEAGRAKTSPPVGPKVLITGWVKPDGHAVGFVFNQEAGGNYLYACNTGDIKDPSRSIVKYRITDIDKTARFFQECSEDSNETRRFFAQKPSAWGLQRCAKSQQPPDSLDKSSQKRGNCPIASRKACLLAMLWSTSRENDVPAKMIKSTYKEMTTRFRQEGVQQAIESGSVPLMGRALVSMLTKFDRPSCQVLAYQLAVAILAHKESPSKGPKTDAVLQIPPVTSDKYLTTLRSALKESRQDLKSRKPYYTGDIRIHALRKKNTQAAEIIRRLSS